jgi:predicted nucleic acid-binding protein
MQSELAYAGGRHLVLLLDSEAISAVAHGPRERSDRVRALLLEARRGYPPIGTVAAVLAELIRGRREDAAVYSAVRREELRVYAIDRNVGIRAGQLLGAAGAGSELAIDAFLVAVADLEGGAVIATTDELDLRRLAAHASAVVIAPI